MKKLQIIFLIILSITIITSCGASKDEIVVNDGDYFLQLFDDETSTMSQYLSLIDGKFVFSYDPLSSYMPNGNYEAIGDRLILKTDGSKYTYVFRIEHNSLFFVKSESSDVTLTDETAGIQNIVNDSQFVLNN